MTKFLPVLISSLYLTGHNYHWQKVVAAAEEKVNKTRHTYGLGTCQQILPEDQLSIM